MHTQTFVETFFDFYDAYVWLDGHYKDFVKDPDWEITEGQLVMLNGGWRAGISVVKKQGELFSDDETMH